MDVVIALGLIGWALLEVGVPGAVAAVVLMCLAGAGKAVK